MRTRMWKSTSGLALVLLALATGGCEVFSSDKASEANASASDAPVAPSGEISAEPVGDTQQPNAEKATKQPQIVAATPLTRPTDPDARVKAIKKGRSNPFAELVPSSKGNSTPTVNATRRPNSLPPTRSALTNKPSNPPKVVSTSPRNTPSSLPRLDNPAAGKDEIVLPPLPEATLAKEVEVQGVMMIGNQPKAIIKAPNEDVARTVQAGDSISNGQVLVSSIDMSNPQNPKVVLLEAGQTVTVGVGQGAESMTASLPF